MIEHNGKQYQWEAIVKDLVINVTFHLGNDEYQYNVIPLLNSESEHGVGQFIKQEVDSPISDILIHSFELTKAHVLNLIQFLILDLNEFKYILSSDGFIHVTHCDKPYVSIPCFNPLTLELIEVQNGS